MNSFRAILYNRNFNIQAQPAITLKVDRFSKYYIGGPAKASLRATGSQTAVWDMVETLRKPVEIVDQYSRICWWGYVSSVTINQEKFSFGVSLDQMVNRLAVAYSETTPGELASGRRATTTWVQDDDSVSAFGTIEALLSMGDQSLESANSMRDRHLSRFKYPIPEITPGKVTGKGAVTARLECDGWWKTLGWQYYNSLAGLESNNSVGTGIQNMGTSASQKVAQGFQIASSTGWYASMVQIKIRKQEAPADNVIVELQSASGSDPSGTVLASATVGAGSLSDGYEWITFNLNTPVLLSPATTYFIVARRSGGNDNTNYYKVDVEEGLTYPRGSFKLYSGAAWVARDPDADMLFQIGGTMETSAQIYQMLDAAQFVQGIDLPTASGLYRSQYRDGDSSIKTEVEALFNVGVNNGNRYLATITPERWVKVYPEPSSTDTGRLLLDKGGRFYNRFGASIPGHLVEPGAWVRLKDLIPDTLDTNRLADPTTFFMEEVEYDVANRRVIAIPQRAVEAMDTISFTGGS